MAPTGIDALAGTQWAGAGELWLDPLGNDAATYECTLRVKSDAVEYTWTYDGDEQRGTFDLGGEEPVWTDTWHQAEPMTCERRADAWGLLTLWSTYEAGEGPRWGWRTTLSQRPSGELVLQMTNYTPWGEHGRAVRMIFLEKP